MSMFKIVCKKNTKNSFGLVMGKDEAHAIARYRRLSGYAGEVLAMGVK